MRQTSKLFLVGVGLSAIVALLAQYKVDTLAGKVSEAVTLCQQEAKASDLASNSWWSKYESYSFAECDESQIRKMSAPLKHGQRSILDAADAVDRWGSVMFYAVLFGILSAIPALWYFLLDRLREVAGAFRSSGLG